MAGGDGLLGNGKLTVLARVSSVLGFVTAIAGLTGGFWYWQQFMQDFQDMRRILLQTQIYIAGAQERGAQFRAVDDQFKVDMQKIQLELQLHDRRIFILEQRTK